MSIQVNALSLWMLPLLSVASLAALSTDYRLADAVEKQDKAAVRSLLNQHVDVNTSQGDGATALIWAAHWDEPETAELLIRAGADVNVASKYGDTPLWEACENGSAAMVERFTKAGANPNTTLLRTGETALMRCARTGNADAVKALLDHGADVNVKEKDRGQTALMWALEESHPEAARLLIEHGADIHVKSKGGFTPLLFAARQGDVETGRLLVERGADVNETAPGGLNALLLATDSGREKFAIFLVEKGANSNKADPDGLTALHYSLRKGITILRDGKHRGDANEEYTFRPDMPELVNALLEHGANPNARITKNLRRYIVNGRPMLALPGATPFLLAAAAGDVGIMRALLAKGADPKLATNDNATPLMVAAGLGRWAERTKAEQEQALEAVKLLVDLGADVNAASNDLATNIPAGGMTALHGAAFAGADEIIKFLVDKGANLDAQDFFGMTPLSIAEGDPNALMADFIEAPGRESTANLLRKLGGETMVQGDRANSSTVPAN